MGISSLNKQDVLNWELITTSSPSGLSTITISSIDTIYSKLLIAYDLTSSGNINNLTLRLNNDSGTNYIANASVTQSSSALALTSNDQIGICLSGGYSQTTWRGLTIIAEASTINAKTVTASGGASGGTNQVKTISDGFYAASAAITRIDLLHNAALSGTVKLYGVRA